MGKRKHLAQILKEAIDTYPGGICFAMTDGRPILVNRTFNRLTAQLTGHTVMDVLALWEELCSRDTRNGCRKIVKNWDISPMNTENTLGFQLPDGTIWQFRQEILDQGSQCYLQMEANDVTALYTKSNDLLESNRKLRELSRRQHRLMADIVQVNRERELLRAKVRIHADLGQCIVAAKKALAGQMSPEEKKTMIQAWQNSIRNLASISDVESSPEASMETELLQVARMIGCSIRISGPRPGQLRVQQLMYAAIREALTNAVRHANASELLVVCRKDAGLWHIEITDNGQCSCEAVAESGGLGSLRRQLEQEGAILQIDCREGVRLIVDIPELQQE